MAKPFLAKGKGADVYLIDAPPPLWAELIDDDVPKAIAPSATVDVTFHLRNRGSLTWTPGAVELAPTPRDKASTLCDPSWPSCLRAASMTSTVETNGETMVKVRLRAPDSEGVITACFGLVAGKHWFSDPGSNGPMDDTICRTIAITHSAIGDDELDPDGGINEETDDSKDLKGGCACQTSTGANTRENKLAIIAACGAMLSVIGLRKRSRSARRAH